MIKAIDLFAGIGGIRLGFERAFGKDIEFVYSNEIDKFACQTYEANFGENPMGDITKIDMLSIPKFDLLLAGFPCQSFSIAGKQLGFHDTRGSLFYEIASVLIIHKPKCFMLENVKNLLSHDKGRTIKVIINTLESIGYHIYITTLNAKHFGLPQNRERVFIVGFDTERPFKFPDNHSAQINLSSILENNVPIKYYLTQRYLDGLKAHRARNEAKGNGFGYIVLKYAGIANTIVCGGSGHERNLVHGTLRIKNDEAIRKMTPREWARLQGFPESFKLPCSNTQTYKQLANSVPVLVIEAIAIKIMEALK